MVSLRTRSARRRPVFAKSASEMREPTFSPTTSGASICLDQRMRRPSRSGKISVGYGVRALADGLEEAGERVEEVLGGERGAVRGGHAVPAEVLHARLAGPVEPDDGDAQVGAAGVEDDDGRVGRHLARGVDVGGEHRERRRAGGEPFVHLAVELGQERAGVDAGGEVVLAEERFEVHAGGLRFGCAGFYTKRARFATRLPRARASGRIGRMNVLVTGAAGFIGAALSERLLGRGHSVVGLDNFNDYYDPALKEARAARLEGRPGFRMVRADLADAAALGAVFGAERFDVVVNLAAQAGVFDAERFDVVVNLAAQAGVRYSLVNPGAYVQSNLVGFVNVLECCRHHGLPRLVYASSSSVYGGNEKMPFSEDDRVDSPVSLYAATKKSNELLAHVYAHLFGLQTIGLRFFTVYGPWGRPDMAMWLFADAMLAGRPIKVFNHGKMKRDFTYVDDIVSGVVACVESRNLGPEEIFNIGNNRRRGAEDGDAADAAGRRPRDLRGHLPHPREARLRADDADRRRRPRLREVVSGVPRAVNRRKALENLRVVLVGTLYGGNVGSACRAMANCGVRELRLVAPDPGLTWEFAERMAVHAPRAAAGSTAATSPTRARSRRSCSAWRRRAPWRSSSGERTRGSSTRSCCSARTSCRSPPRPTTRATTSRRACCCSATSSTARRRARRATGSWRAPRRRRRTCAGGCSRSCARTCSRPASCRRTTPTT